MQMIGHRQVQGVQAEVWVNIEGNWKIVHENNVIGLGDSVDKALTNARVKLNKSRVLVKVPCFTKQGEKIYGQSLNLKTGGPIAINDNDEKIDLGRSDRVFKPDIPQAILDKYIANVKTIDEARNSNRHVEREWEMTLGDVVQKAIDDAVKIRDGFEGLEDADRYSMARNLIADGINVDLVLEHARLSAVQNVSLRRGNPLKPMGARRRR